MKHILKNWKTSILGIAAATPQIYSAVETGSHGGWIAGVATILLGLFTKDGDQTGLAK